MFHMPRFQTLAALQSFWILVPIATVVRCPLATMYRFKNNQWQLPLLQVDRHFRHMEEDPDLDSVRQDKRYKELLIKYKKR